jgi:hypothetical protein
MNEFFFLLIIFVFGIFYNLDKYFQYKITKDHLKHEKWQKEFRLF